MTDELRNIPDLFERQANRLGDAVAVRHRRVGMWVDVSWSECRERVESAALGWGTLGLREGDRVAILSENRLEWALADLAIMYAGGVTVPLHAPLGAGQIQHMLADSGAAAVVVSTAAQEEKVRSIFESLPALRDVVVMDVSPTTRIDDVAHPRVLSLRRLEQLGRSASAETRQELSRRRQALTPEHLASILYTSGTTGLPKGVMLTHANFLSNTLAMNQTVGPLGTGVLVFNWLPLSHVYARTVDYYLAIAAGATLVLAESAETVVENLRDIHPMHLSSVPRFYEKLLGSLAGQTADAKKKALRAIFGPRIAWLGSGGAALPRAVANEYCDAGFNVVVGYGLTESSPVIATNRLGANKIGTVGQAIPNVEIKIADDGEILTRGPHVMKGYWNQPDATAAVIKDGWLHTGDLGRLDGEGYLTITGRKKDLIVLSSGKNVAPTPLEGLLVSSPLIEQAVIFGDGRPFLSAVIVPRDEALKRELQRCGHGDGAALLLECVERILAEVAPWEKVRKIVVATEALSVDRKELTVSMKVRRSAVYENYRAEIEGLY